MTTPGLQIELLSRAFAQILGHGTSGEMAFSRCLTGDVANDLGESSQFCPTGWHVYVVTDKSNPSCRQISSDIAVELREDKRGRILLLVDPQLAGAGMDGIYSAGREINEEQLFDATGKVIRNEVGRAAFERGEAALRRARKITGRVSLSRWREFEFLTGLVEAPGAIGDHLGRIGLWPVDTGGQPISDTELDTSIRMVQRLIIGTGQEKAPTSRVRALLLDQPTREQELKLEQLVRESRTRTVSDIVRSIELNRDIWLNRIRPGFLDQNVHAITLKSWRLSSGKVAKWSGLSEAEPPEFLLPLADVQLSAAKQPRMEVRFETTPADLVAGSVEYRVSVMAGDEELASRIHSHQNKALQTVRLTSEDFPEVDEDSMYEAQVRVSVIGSDAVPEAISELFIVKHGEPKKRGASENARFVQALIDGALNAETVDDFDSECQNPLCFSIDNRRGFVVFKPQKGHTSYKAAQPSVVREIESLQTTEEGIGRWQVRVRANGVPAGPPVFSAVQQNNCSKTNWDRLLREWQRFREESIRLGSTWGRIYSLGQNRIAEDYINAWANAVEEGNHQLTLAHTLEVQTLSGKTLGLVVLPSHPTRVAWHMAYDQLARHLRYDLHTSAEQTRKELEALSSTYYPAILPGLNPSEHFIFADTLGFYAAAMVSDGEQEPKAAVAILKTALGYSEEEVIASVGMKTSELLTREFQRYADFHNFADLRNSMLLVNAVRPGDGSTIVRALGGIQIVDDDDENTQKTLRFKLELYPSDRNTDVAGQFLTRISENNRTGTSGIKDADRWMLQTDTLPGNVRVPRLRWARRSTTIPETPAHVSVIFDTFNTRVAYMPSDQTDKPSALHAFGLAVNMQRVFVFGSDIRWDSWFSPNNDGQKHPVARSLTDRLLRMQKCTLQACAINAGKPDHIPVIRTTLPEDLQESLRQVHRLSDWVITVDRNAGVEFFDSPKNDRAIYDAYVIDCVPERSDLGTLQMVTSTTKTDEVRDILDDLLANMGMSSSRRNCEYLLDGLKGLSGRLAMRLTSGSARTEELVGLAMTYANCKNAPDSSKWLSLNDGFIIPIDDVPDLSPRRTGKIESDDKQVRSDLIYVGLGSRGTGLSFTFVEIKYRRYLRTARDPELLEQIERQAEDFGKRWLDWYFSPNISEPITAIRRTRLVRALRFYLDKASRHTLSPERYQLFLKELEKLVGTGNDYVRTEVEYPWRGYVFCPEVMGGEPINVSTASTLIYLFGPGLLPELVGAGSSLPSPLSPIAPPQIPISNAGSERENEQKLNEVNDDAELPESIVQPEDGEFETVVHSTSQPQDTPLPEITLPTSPSSSSSSTAPEVALIRLGEVKTTGDPVNWSVSSKSNPHLMIVGLPGMGKTESLINICGQMYAQGIVPIVFSYHPDIDERLQHRLGKLRILNHQELGFDPMYIDDPKPQSHIESASMLRDIFSAIYPDLGGVQLNRIRQAIKQEYEQAGWGKGEVSSTTPGFRQFLTKLQREPKPDRMLQNLLGRLVELDDYGIFETTGSAHSLLDSDVPSVMSIHATQNEVVQRAIAMLSLYSIYKEMFKRGIQKRITHAIIFDEAHRASKLKLISRIAVEGRKFGLALVVASQAARDFDDQLFSGIASYLVLRATEQDALVLARNISTSDHMRNIADKVKQLPKYQALFFQEGQRLPSILVLTPP